MINEKQKRTTDKYRENYDAIFAPTSKSQAKRLAIQSAPTTPDVEAPDCNFVESSSTTDSGVGGEGGGSPPPVDKGRV